jgi:hypothetical protein
MARPPLSPEQRSRAAADAARQVRETVLTGSVTLDASDERSA